LWEGFAGGFLVEPDSCFHDGNLDSTSLPGVAFGSGHHQRCLGKDSFFGVIEFSLGVWLNLLRWLQWEEWRFEVEGEWEPQFYLVYYATLLGLLGLWKKFSSRRLYN